MFKFLKYKKLIVGVLHFLSELSSLRHKPMPPIKTKSRSKKKSTSKGKK